MAEEKLYAYAGEILHVDLTEGTVNKLPVTRELIANYIGGFGFTAKLAYDFVTPRADALSPANAMVIGAPLLGGTFAPTTGRTVIMAKSPLTGFMGVSHMGEPGAMLKFAGYDQLVVTGKAAKPSYIKIHEDDVEIVSAAHIWGLTIPETVDALWRDLGGKFYVTCIGPAGENLVRFASVITNKFSAAGRCGLGAVMGSKNLKAIAVYGDRPVEVAQPGRFARIANDVLKRMTKHPFVPAARKYGTLFQFYGDVARQRSKQRYRSDGTPMEPSEVFDIDLYYNKLKPRCLTCFACPIGCKQEIDLKEGESSRRFPISCSVGTMTRPFGYQLSVTKYEDVAKCAAVNNSYGLDASTTDYTIALIIELHHKGIITREDTDGLIPEWGDTKVITELIRKIALREGVGNVLAEGPVNVCKKLGLDPDDYLIHAKNFLITPIMDPRRDFGPEILGACVNPRGGHWDYHRPLANLYLRPDYSMKYMKGVCEKLGVPEKEMDKVVTGEGHWFCNLAQLVRYVEDFSIVLYSFGTCDRDYVNTDVYDMKVYEELFLAATGIKMSIPELLRAGERVWNLQRMFNLREGASRKDDRLPRMYHTEKLRTVGQEYPPFDVEIFNKTLDEYYAIRDWDREGRPTKAKLAELGLSEDF